MAPRCEAVARYWPETLHATETTLVSWAGTTWTTQARERRVDEACGGERRRFGLEEEEEEEEEACEDGAGATRADIAIS